DRSRQTHDLLDDFQLLYDELNDNIDTYVERKNDIRKPLKVILDADTEFQAKLRALKDAADVPPAEVQQYAFVLDNAIETVDSSREDHRRLVWDQEEGAKHKTVVRDPSTGTGVSPEWPAGLSPFVNRSPARSLRSGFGGLRRMRPPPHYLCSDFLPLATK